MILYFLNTTPNLVGDRLESDICLGFPQGDKDRITQFITATINNSNLPKTTEFAQDFAIATFVILPSTLGGRSLSVIEPASSRAKSILVDHANPSQDNQERMQAQQDLHDYIETLMGHTESGFNPIHNAISNMTVTLLCRAGLSYTKENAIPIFSSFLYGLTLLGAIQPS